MVLEQENGGTLLNYQTERNHIISEDSSKMIALNLAQGIENLH